MKFEIITLGCKVNIYESEIIREQLLLNGYEESDEFDVVIINTCTVTNQADSKSRKLIRSAKRERPNCITVVCGCMSENHRSDLEELDIDILLGNKDKSKIVDLIEEFKINKKKIFDFYDMQKLQFEDMQVNKFTSHTRAFLKIQDGCNNYCSFCIIPYVRGNLRSKDINVAYSEVQELVDYGHKEVVLTGIHTGSYGLETDFDLVDLIRKISTIDGLERIRISSIEVTELNDKFIEELRVNNKICNHLHIPLQNGSDKILKLMNRKYNTDKFLEIINKIRDVRENISITTDVIVGFPHEDENDFNDCVDFIEKVKFSKLHVFPYSKRDGTVASKMDNQVDDRVKKERASKLNIISSELEKLYSNKFINKEVEVLIEEIRNNHSIGHTSNYLKVVVDQVLEINKNYIIRIIDERLNGEVVDVTEIRE